MADVYHKEGTTDWNDANSWETSTGGAGTVPVSTNGVYIAEGADVINTNVTGHTAVDCASIYVTENFRGTIGGSGTSLTIACDNTSTGVLTYEAGGGAMYYTAGTAGCYLLRVQPRAGKFWLTGGTINSGIEVSSGELDINASAVVNTKFLRCYGGTTEVAYKGSDVITTHDVRGGIVTMRRVCTTINVTGGVLNLFVEAAATGTTTLNLFGGTVRHYAGNIPVFNVYGGTYDGTVAARPITLGATTTIIGANANIKVCPLITLPTSNITYQGKRNAIAGGLQYT